MKLDGTYNVHLVVMGQFQAGKVVIRTEPDGSLSGTLEAMDQTADFSKGVQDGNNFDITVSVRGTEMGLQGTIDDNGVMNAKARKGYLTVVVRGKREE